MLTDGYHDVPAGKVAAVTTVPAELLGIDIPR